MRAFIQNAFESKGGRRVASHAAAKKSVGVGRAPATAVVESELDSFVQALRERDCKVSSRMIKKEASRLKPDVFGERPPPLTSRATSSTDSVSQTGGAALQLMIPRW